MGDGVVSVRQSEGQQAERGKGLRQVIDMEALMIWSVQKEFAHLYADSAGLYEGEEMASGIEPHGNSGCGVVQMQKIAGLGCRPDQSGGNTHCHPDAETVVLVGREILGVHLLYALLVPFAKTGTRPDWGADMRPLEAEPRYVWDTKAHEYRPIIMTAGKVKAPYCAVKYRDRSTEMHAARGYYLAWWDALDKLAEGLAGRLDRFEATPPTVPRKPWELKNNPQNPVANGGGS